MPLLRPNDLVRLVSPASRPDPAGIERRAKILRDWGLRVEVAPHAFDQLSYLAGSDDDRLSDLTDALLDPKVRAVFATRVGKGSYRILHRLPFEAVARDPKPVVGFSDITALHLALWRECRSIGVHGALTGDAEDRLSLIAARSLRTVLMEDGPFNVEVKQALASFELTTSGRARGRLIGGNLEMIATTSGWALPSLRGAILLIESAGLAIGQFDRILTMLMRAGHLNGVAGIAIGHVHGTPPNPPLDAIVLLRQHLSELNVPILGGLPIGHDADASSIVIGMMTEIDADHGTLIQRPEEMTTYDMR
ncbi:MAG: LD-carboxypeptidase [Pelagibacterium sp.]|uniref:S66 peptidase family protein n=1 Tax=Pelagibacterium sp. TaxID=1967288 RepID=UPI0032EADB2A